MVAKSITDNNAVPTIEAWRCNREKKRSLFQLICRVAHIAYPLLFVVVAIMPVWCLLHSTTPTGAAVACLILAECVLQVGLLMLHDRAMDLTIGMHDSRTAAAEKPSTDKNRRSAARCTENRNHRIGSDPTPVVSRS